MIKKIILICPASVKTGGTELIHQFAYYINTNSKLECLIYYIKKDERRSVTDKDFLKYKPIVTDKIDDNADSLLIVPEINVLFLNGFNSIKKSIWWLSVDNFGKEYEPFFKFKTYTSKSHAMLSCIHNLDFIKKPLRLNDVKKSIKNADFNMFQCEYCKEYVTKRYHIQNNIYMLSDYISDEYANSTIDYSKKKNWIAYNPRKGFEITKKLIEFAPDLDWKPIENMTTEQVKDFLQECKVYIDFGNFPGKDRMPREAAMSGCCIITGTRGAAKYQQDVDIPKQYKFDDPLNNKKEVITCIQNCLNNYEDKINDFSNYRKEIKGEKKKFYQEIDSFLKVLDAETK